MTKVLYPELSYKIVGILFNVHNALGNKYQEKYYQRAIAIELDVANISYEKERVVELTYRGQGLGRYFIDFVIDSKMVLEIKAIPRLSPTDFRQVRAYLKAEKLELGLLVNFRTEKLQVHRILNPYLD